MQGALRSLVGPVAKHGDTCSNASGGDQRSGLQDGKCPVPGTFEQKEDTPILACRFQDLIQVFFSEHGTSAGFSDQISRFKTGNGGLASGFDFHDHNSSSSLTFDAKFLKRILIGVAEGKPG